MVFRYFIVLMSAFSFNMLYGMEDELLKGKPVALLKEIAADVCVYDMLKSNDVSATQQKMAGLPEEMREYVQMRTIHRPMGRSFLHSASSCSEISQLIDGIGVNPLARTFEDETPLLTLMRDGKKTEALALLDILKKKGLKNNQKDMYGTTALALASLYGDSELIKKLGGNVGAKPQSFLDRSSAQIQQWFVYPKKSEHHQIKDFLFAYLQQPSWDEGVQFLKNLPHDVTLSALRNAAVQADSLTGLTPLHCVKNKEQLLLLLSLCGSNFNYHTKEGQSPLHTMLKVGNFDAAMTLLEQDPMSAVDSCDVHGMTPLCYAYLAKNPDLIQMLLARNANPAQSLIINKRRIHPLMFFLKPTSDYKHHLVSEIFSPDVVSKLDPVQKMDLLRVAYKYGYEAVVQAVLGDETVATIRWNGKSFPMYLAQKNDKKTLQKVLQEIDDLEYSDGLGETLLFYGINKKTKTLDSILKKKVNIYHQNHQGQTALHTAAMQGFARIKELLAIDASGVNTADHSGKTALHCALEKGHDAVAIMLMAYHADVNQHDNHGHTSLHYAAGYCPGMVDLILDYCPLIDMRNGRGDTPLHIALMSSHKEKSKMQLYENAAKMLIACGADVNAQNKYGKAPLHHAAKNFPHVVADLLKKKPVIDIRNKKRQTPLMLALEASNKEAAQQLIDAGADVNVQDVNGITPLMLCVKNDLPAIFIELLQKGADPACVDKKGRNCLAWVDDDEGKHIDYSSFIFHNRKK